MTFFRLVSEACQANFKQNIDKVLSHLSPDGKVKDEHIRSLMFGDYMSQDAAKVYDEVTDLKELTAVMDRSVGRSRSDR